MTDGARPYCAMCHSGAVDSERDRADGVLIIYCRTCGNRTSPGSPNSDTAFYMKGEEGMAKKGTCSNCGRPDMVLVSGDLCGTCYAAIRGIPKGTEKYTIELCKVANRIKAGKMGRWKKNDRVTEGEEEPVCDICGRGEMALEKGICPICRANRDKATNTVELSGVTELENILEKDPEFADRLTGSQTDPGGSQAVEADSKSAGEEASAAQGGATVTSIVIRYGEQRDGPETAASTDGEAAPESDMDTIIAGLKQKYPKLAPYLPNVIPRDEGESSEKTVDAVFSGQQAAAPPATIGAKGGFQRGIGVCRICKFKVYLQSRGLCRPCQKAVKGIPEGTEEYEKAAAEAQERRANGFVKPLTRNLRTGSGTMPVLKSPTSPDGGVIPVHLLIDCEINFTVRVNGAITS